ncbi:MAG: hypothetical protein CM15mP71_4910 [Candidatus Poseidoniales archaeon]|nr:MAG: hypothetical protein CM15mP71_4910 [Candidatus Poseidoniales archaeon]
MGIFAFKLPDIGEGVVEGEVVEWMVAVGDTVKEDDPILSVMTDKATVEIPSPTDGVVKSLVGEPGTILAVGQVCIEFETDGEGTPVEEAPAPVEEVVEEAPAPEPEPVKGKGFRQQHLLTHQPQRQLRLLSQHPVQAASITCGAPACRESGIDLTTVAEADLLEELLTEIWIHGRLLVAL